MDINTLQNTKDTLKIEIKGESHSLCNALTKELWNDKSVKSTGYMLESTMEENPIMTIKSTNKPKKALLDASKRLSKKLDEFQKKFKALK